MRHYKIVYNGISATYYLEAKNETDAFRMASRAHTAATNCGYLESITVKAHKKYRQLDMRVMLMI